MGKVEKLDIQLSDEEKALVEAKRKEQEQLASFYEKYKELITEFGYALVVNPESPVGRPTLVAQRVRLESSEDAQ